MKMTVIVKENLHLTSDKSYVLQYLAGKGL